MSWWNRFLHKQTGSSSGDPMQRINFTLPGWKEEAPQQDLRVWRDADGDVLSLTVPAGGIDYPFESDEQAQRQWCRELASGAGGGLIEVEVQPMPSATTHSVTFIYKRLVHPAYVYTGMFLDEIEGISRVWTIVAREQGTTGEREAVVTVKLMEAGKLTPANYEDIWAQDPYEPAFRSADRSVLRFMSDDRLYDEEFPRHPLSKVRHILALLPRYVGRGFRTS